MSLREKRVINIGDQIQLLSIMNLYKQMGVDQKEVELIEYYDLWDYDGEELVLPINYIWFNPFYGERPLILSPKITPVFLGIHIIGDAFSSEEIEYLRKYEPIGCRDEYTFNLLKEFGIKVFLHGCLTATFTRIIRYDRKQRNTVFFIDVDEELKNKFPLTDEKTVVS